MSKPLTKSYKVYRDARTGKFVSSKTAKSRPTTTVSGKITKQSRVSAKSAKVIGSINVKYGKVLDRLAKR